MTGLPALVSLERAGELAAQASRRAFKEGLVLGVQLAFGVVGLALTLNEVRSYLAARPVLVGTRRAPVEKCDDPRCTYCHPLPN